VTNSNEAAIRDIYEETRRFYQERVPSLGLQAHGFRILYGPPITHSPILFVGYQPGGDASHIVESHHLGWPSQSDYAVKEWKLAKRIREIWNASDVERATGLNAIFFRAPSAMDWRRVSLPLRKEMEQFSHARARKLIGILAPKRIVFVGMGTMACFVDASEQVLRLDRRTLIKKGDVSGVPAYGVIHLSGARIRSTHLSAIGDFFRQISNCPTTRLAQAL
jgi:hypothetical protein